MFDRRDKLIQQEFEDLGRTHPEAGRLLAGGRGAVGVALACDHALAVQRADDWLLVPWHEIQKGGWDEDLHRLKWTTVQGEEDAVVLEETGRLPEVFNERVHASILVQQQVPVPGGTAIIAGRRPVGEGHDTSDVTWQVTVTGRARLSDPETQAIVMDATERLQSDSGLD